MNLSGINYKTFIPALVGAGVLVYEAYTGHEVDKSMQSNIVNGALTAIGVVATVWGMVHNHEKKSNVEKQIVTPDTGTQVAKETQDPKQETPQSQPVAEVTPQPTEQEQVPVSSQEIPKQ